MIHPHDDPRVECCPSPRCDRRRVTGRFQGAVPLAALADDQFSVPARRQAAQRGRLDAIQGPDGIWRSSRHAVNDYAATKHTRRPKAG